MHLFGHFLNSVLTIFRPWCSVNSANMSTHWFLSPKPYWPVHFSMHCPGCLGVMFNIPAYLHLLIFHFLALLCIVCECSL